MKTILFIGIEFPETNLRRSCSKRTSLHGANHSLCFFKNKHFQEHQRRSKEAVIQAVQTSSENYEPMKIQRIRRDQGHHGRDSEKMTCTYYKEWIPKRKRNHLLMDMFPYRMRACTKSVHFSAQLELCGVRVCHHEVNTTQDHGRCKCTDSKHLRLEQVSGHEVHCEDSLAPSNQAALVTGSLLLVAKSS